MENHVGMGFSQCPVCLKQHDEVVLLATKYKSVGGNRYGQGSTLEPVHPIPKSSCMGHSLCPDCASKSGEYLALVEATMKPTCTKQGNVKPEDMNYTGNYAHIRRALAARIFNVALPADLPMTFVEPGVLEQLAEMQGESA